MTRYGPLVWSVCRSILSDPHDVEDAFQASFLILVRTAHMLRIGDSLCGWLYRVSYRVAQEARVQRDRRRVRERAAVDRVSSDGETEPASEELLSVLSQEINRLPEKYRLPIVLCRLEGLTRRQAASQLGWQPGTVATRLVRGQDLLRQRMRRRLGYDAGGLQGWLGGLASTTVPGACRETTTQVALTLINQGWGAAGLSSSAFTLARSVQRALFWTILRLDPLARSLSKNQLKPHKDLRRKPNVSVFEISGKTLHCHVKQRRKLLFAIDLILGPAPSVQHFGGPLDRVGMASLRNRPGAAFIGRRLTGGPSAGTRGPAGARESESRRAHRGLRPSDLCRSGAESRRPACRRGDGLSRTRVASPGSVTKDRPPWGAAQCHHLSANGSMQ